MSYLKSDKLVKDGWNMDKAERFIHRIIGEPIIRKMLEDMLHEKIYVDDKVRAAADDYAANVFKNRRADFQQPLDLLKNFGIIYCLRKIQPKAKFCWHTLTVSLPYILICSTLNRNR